jgi:hypothetical protein
MLYFSTAEASNPVMFGTDTDMLLTPKRWLYEKFNLKLHYVHISELFTLYALAGFPGNFFKPISCSVYHYLQTRNSPEWLQNLSQSDYVSYLDKSN